MTWHSDIFVLDDSEKLVYPVSIKLRYNYTKDSLSYYL